MTTPEQNGDTNIFQAIFDDLQSTFESDITKDLQWRRETLQQCLKLFQGENTARWTEALIKDLGGGEIKCILEIGTIIDEIETCLHNLSKWAADRPAKLGDPMLEIPLLDKRVVRPTPKGVTLTIGAWNFPMNLLFVPMVAALAAGNCCILKPSEMAPYTAALAKELVEAYLPQGAIRVVLGGVPETTALLELPWDHITVTGSTFVGKVVMAAAAKNLTPCTLELGGKSPTFVDKSASLGLAADRIMLAKSMNAGQWCIDVDYVMVDETVADEFVQKILESAKKMIGDESQQMGDGIAVSQQWYNRIINERHTERLKAYLEEDHGGEVLLGGLDGVDVKKRFFPLTVVKNPKMGTKLMEEEIFGPILVIKTVSNVDEAIKISKSVCSSPLALYVYSNDDRYTQKVLTKCTSGSAAINTCGEQILANSVPFGGVGQSGFGAYHGKAGFDEYSHMRSILHRTNVLPIMFFPSFMMSRANAFPTWARPFMEKKFITGFVPKWVKHAFFGTTLGMFLYVAFLKLG